MNGFVAAFQYHDVILYVLYEDNSAPSGIFEVKYLLKSQMETFKQLHDVGLDETERIIFT